MSRSRCRLAGCLQSRVRLRWQPPALALLSLLGWLGPAAGAKETNKTICCRSSGGTRGTCLNLWAQLVPLSNRFDPTVSRTLAVLQGPSPQPTAMTLQFSTLAGEPVGEQILPPRAAGIRLITLPDTAQAALPQPLVWESFPTCRPNKPPTRSQLVSAPSVERDATPKALAGLLQSCGGVVATDPLLRTFGMEEFSAALPQQLPVHCERLTVDLLRTN